MMIELYELNQQHMINGPKDPVMTKVIPMTMSTKNFLSITIGDYCLHASWGSLAVSIYYNVLDRNLVFPLTTFFIKELIEFLLHVM